MTERQIDIEELIAASQDDLADIDASELCAAMNADGCMHGLLHRSAGEKHAAAIESARSRFVNAYSLCLFDALEQYRIGRQSREKMTAFIVEMLDTPVYDYIFTEEEKANTRSLLIDFGFDFDTLGGEIDG